MLPDISRILDISIDYLLGVTDSNNNAALFGKNAAKNPHIRENPLDFLLTDELTIIFSSNLFLENKNGFIQEVDKIMKGIPELRNEMAKKEGC